MLSSALIGCFTVGLNVEGSYRKETGKIYISISAVKVKVNNALTQINFNGTHFINARLTQSVFSV